LVSIEPTNLCSSATRRKGVVIFISAHGLVDEW